MQFPCIGETNTKDEPDYDRVILGCIIYDGITLGSSVYQHCNGILLQAYIYPFPCRLQRRFFYRKDSGIFSTFQIVKITSDVSRRRSSSYEECGELTSVKGKTAYAVEAHHGSGRMASNERLYEVWMLYCNKVNIIFVCFGIWVRDCGEVT